MPSNVQLAERAPVNWRSNPDTETGRQDLFCLVKAEMSSKNLCQDPLLVWPGVLQQQSKRFLEVANTTAHLEVPSFDDERKGDIKRLIDAMKRDYPDMQRAIAWYQSLLDRESSQTREPYTTLTFLRNVPDEEPNIHDFQLGAPPPAQQPHNLQVVFHRRPL